MTRIVAGSAKGRTLAVPKSGTRPTSERVREALFSRLDHMNVLNGTVVLDLYAGTGALGLGHSRAVVLTQRSSRKPLRRRASPPPTSARPVCLRVSSQLMLVRILLRAPARICVETLTLFSSTLPTRFPRRT